MPILKSFAYLGTTAGVAMFSSDPSGTLVPIVNPLFAGSQTVDITNVSLNSIRYTYLVNTLNQTLICSTDPYSYGLTLLSTLSSTYATNFRIVKINNNYYGYICNTNALNSNISANTITMYSINTTNGSLTVLSPATVSTGLNTKPTRFYNITINGNNYAYTCNYVGKSITMLSIDPSGQLTPLSPSLFSLTSFTNLTPTSLTFATINGNNYAYVVGDTKEVVMFKVELTGQLTLLSPSSINIADNRLDAYVVTSVTINLNVFVYVGGYASPICMYSVNPTTGILEPLSTPSIPLYTALQFMTTDVINGVNYLYAGGNQNTTCYSINSSSGQLTSLSEQPRINNKPYTAITTFKEPPEKICFNEGSKILYFNSLTNQEEYIEIEKLRKGDLVKTISSGFKQINNIGYAYMYNNINNNRSKDKLYKCSKSEYPELIEDLIITGCHSILVKKFKDDTQREKAKEVLGHIYVTDNCYRLPVCVDDRSKMYEVEGRHTIWHFSLENDDYYMNYGVFANGLLVETTSNRMMEEHAGLNLIE